MYSAHWANKRNSFHFVKTRISPDIAKQDFVLGLPSLLIQISSGIVMITFNTIILKLEGNTGVAAYGVIANLSLVTVAVYTGISQGVQPLISRFYGTGNKKQIQNMLWYALITTLTASCFIYIVIFIFAHPIAAVFNSAHDTKLQRIAVTGLKLYFTSSLFVGFNIVLSVFFTSVEQPLPSHILSILRGLVLIIPTAFIFSTIWGMIGVWLTYPITELLTAVLGYATYKHYYIQKGRKK